MGYGGSHNAYRTTYRSVPFSHQVDAGNQIKVVRLGSRHLFSKSHFPSPEALLTF